MTDPTPVVADLLADAWDEGAADVSDQTPTAPKGPPMPDLTPDATTTPNFDPGRVAIVSGWLVYDVGHHTCGGYGPGSGYVHEPGCGLEGIVEVAALPALLDAAAERDALLAAVNAHVELNTRRDTEWDAAAGRLNDAEVQTALMSAALDQACEERDALLAERDALAAKVEDLECVLAGAGVCVECYANGWHKLDCSRRSTARALDGEARP